MTIQSLSLTSTAGSPAPTLEWLAQIIEGNLEVTDEAPSDSGFRFVMPLLGAIAGDVTFANVDNLQLVIPGFFEAAHVSFRNVSFGDSKLPIFNPNGLDLTEFDLENTNLENLSLVSTNRAPATLNVHNNPTLQHVTLTGAYKGAISILDNNDHCNVTLLDPEIASLRISNTNSFSAPVLTNISIESTLADNTFSELDLSSLVSATQLSITNNSKLGDVLFDSLDYVGSLEISNNPLLRDVNLPKLTNVSNSLGLSGDFSRYVKELLNIYPRAFSHR